MTTALAYNKRQDDNDLAACKCGTGTLLKLLLLMIDKGFILYQSHLKSHWNELQILSLNALSAIWSTPNFENFQYLFRLFASGLLTHFNKICWQSALYSLF